MKLKSCSVLFMLQVALIKQRTNSNPEYWCQFEWTKDRVTVKKKEESDIVFEIVKGVLWFANGSSQPPVVNRKRERGIERREEKGKKRRVSGCSPPVRAPPLRWRYKVGRGAVIIRKGSSPAASIIIVVRAIITRSSPAKVAQIYIQCCCLTHTHIHRVADKKRGERQREGESAPEEEKRKSQIPPQAYT